MTLSVKHKFVNPKSDTGDTSVTRASNWNADHDIEMASGRVLGRVSSGVGSAEELTAEQARALLEISPPGVLSGINTRTASYTLVASDRNKAIEMNVSTANTVTIPNESGLSGVNFAVGTQILVIQLGTGTTTLLAGAGVTLRSVAGGLSTLCQYGALLLYKRGSNDWLVMDQTSAFFDGSLDGFETRVAALETVAGSMSNVATVAGSIANVNTLAPVAGAMSNLSNAVTNGDLLTDVYQGAGSVDPTTRLDGSALQNGDFYFNTSTNRTRTRANGVWYDAYPGGNTNADLVAYTPSGTGAVATTVQTKLRQTVSVFDFMTSAQIASVQARDALVDVSGAIQAAINAVRPASEIHPEKGATIYFPAGTYMVNSTINMYSGVNLVGEGVGTVIFGGASLTSAVFYLTQAGTAGYHVASSIKKMKIQTVPDIFTAVANTIWAIKADPALIIGGCTFADLILWVRYGLKLDGYTQNVLIHTVSSIAQVDQVLNLRGNYNRIVSLDKENGGGEGLAGSGVATTEPYVFVGGAPTAAAPTYGHNIFEDLLIQGAGSPSKCAIKLQNAIQTQIKDYYQELSQTNGFSIELDASSLHIEATLANGLASGGKYKLRNGSYMYIKEFENAAGYDPWQSFFDYDNQSFVEIQTLATELSLDIYKISSSANLILHNYVDRRLVRNSIAGRTPFYRPHYRSGQNLFMNPSFEAGIYGWNIGSGTVSFEQSEIAQGNMLKLITTAAGIDQALVIAAAQVGAPLTLTYVVKLVGAGFVFPVIGNYSAATENRVYAGTGWQTVTITYRPQSAGTLYSGISMAGGGGASCTLYLDEMSLCFGDEGIVNTSKFGSFELNQRTFTAATAEPATGTWKAGDRVFNSVPAVGQPKGWICTVAGTPGTWVSEGNL